MNINKVLLYGNLTRDPEIQQLPSGMNIAKIGLATNRVYNNQQGERVEEVEYHNVTFFGHLAELAQQYLTRGKGIWVEGRLRTTSWDDKETGQKRYRTEIVAQQMQFGPRREGEGQGQPPAPAPQKQQAAPQSQQKEPAPARPEATINPDDIPF